MIIQAVKLANPTLVFLVDITTMIIMDVKQGTVIKAFSVVGIIMNSKI